MRTKTLLLTAAIGAAGIATSMAQVYSVNAVGYVNVSIPYPASPSAKIYAIIANPLNGTNNLVETVLPSVPENTVIYEFTGSAYRTTFYGGGGLWAAEDGLPTTLQPGKAFFIELDRTIAPNPTVVTFVGEVPQGNLTNTVPSGYSLRSSIVPQSGGVQSVLGYSPDEGGNDILFDFNIATQAYDVYYYGGGGATAWAPQEPVLQVGRGMFFFNASSPAAPISWGRSFTVN